MKVAETLLKEKQIQGKNDVNQPRTESPAPTSQPRVSSPMGPNSGVGTQGGGVI